MKTPLRLILAVAGAITVVIVIACTRRAPQAEHTPQRSVAVAPVASAALSGQLHVVGLLAPKDEARLSFKVAGVVEAIRVEEGARVRAGQLLAVLKQQEIEAAVTQAREAATKATRDLKRAQALYADGVATQEQVEDLTTASGVARAALAGAEFNAVYTHIVAPTDGVVLKKLAEAHELVQAGQPVLVVGGAERGWVVRIGLADRDVVRVRTGDAASVCFDAWPGRTFTGRISNIASSADSATGTFTVEVRVSPGDANFVDGLVAKVALTPRGEAAHLTVPVQALVEANGDAASVFVFDAAHGTVHRVAIRIGRLSDGAVEVLEGLSDGAQVVVDGAAFVEDGESVRLAARAAPPLRAPG